jgi:CheY-like chemotaxis protein
MNTVLVIDDDEGILALLEMILRRSNKNVLRARNGPEGLEIARTHRPDVIVLDDLLPQMSSAEVCGHLRSDPHISHIPVVLTSAALLQNTGDYARHIGANAFLAKPFQAKQVEAVLSHLLPN